MRSKLFAGVFLFVAAFAALYFGGNSVLANSYYLEIAAGAPLLQDWSDTTLLDNPDDWTQVIGIEAFTGAGLSPTAGADARTILADNPAGTMRVVPNQTDPVNSTADGIAEFQIANPTVALRGSDRDQAPNLVIHVNTTAGCAGKYVSVKYDVRDIDGSANNAVSQVNTQYRIGGSGPYTNVTFGYLADATTGPGQASAVSPRTVTLPFAATGQPKVDIRIMTTNALGTDEWVGIDNIRIDCVHLTAANAVVSGQVRDQNGRGLAKVRVSVFNPSTSTNSTAITNAFGFYQIENLEVGSVYIVNIASKQYTFVNTTQALMLMQDTDGVDFVSN